MTYTAPEIEEHNSDMTTSLGAAQANQARSRLFRIALEFVGLMVATVMVPVIVYLDVAVLSNGMREDSLTEYLHQGLLLVTIVFLTRAAFKFSEARGYLLLGITFFSSLFIREQDAMFDSIFKGFWKVPVLIILLVGGGLVYRNRSTLIGPWLRHFEMRSATFIYIGVLLLLAFTRTFGTGTLWEAVLAENYTPKFKTVVQEGLELMSYTLITYGALTSYFVGFGVKKN
jgi:hypothetical protein